VSDILEGKHPLCPEHIVGCCGVSVRRPLLLLTPQASSFGFQVLEASVLFRAAQSTEHNRPAASDELDNWNPCLI
jgi:hypothetical protein